MAAAAVIAVASLVRFATPPWRDPANPARTQAGPVRDDYEYTIYLKRGAWAPTGLRPYVDVFSEYPPVATWIFGIPFFLVKPEHAPARAMLGALDTAAPTSPVALAYGNAWAVLMAIAWFSVAAVTAQLARALELSPTRALLCLGPASLYCALQRFDPLPALAASSALLAILSGRFRWGFVFLALGAMLKIYPAVLAPLAFGYVAKRAGWREAFAAAAVFVGVLVLAHIPPFLSGWNDPAWSAPWRPQHFAGVDLAVTPPTPARSGLAAVGVPFVFQGERDTNPGSLAERLFRGWLALPYDQLLAGVKVFRIVQLAPALLAFFLGWYRPQPKTLLAASAVLVTSFVLFHNIYSPQFQCWIVPLAAVAGGGLVGVFACALALSADLVTYLQFPIFGAQRIFDPKTQQNVYPAGFQTMVDLRLLLTTALLGTLLWLALRGARESQLSAEAS